MDGVFLRILNMSAAASVVILVVLLARVLLRRAPKKWSYLLWLAAAFRLCCPVSISSALSLFNLAPRKASAGMLTPQAISAALPTQGPAATLPPAASAAPMAIPTSAVQTAAATHAVLPTAASNAGAVISTAAPAPTSAPAAAASLSTGELLLRIGAVLWLCGVAVMLVYGAVSYVRLRKRNANAVRMPGERNVFMTETPGTPYILGIFRPRILVPYGMEGRALETVLAHERCHLKRGDNVIKALSYLILSVHWFNPLCWLAFRLMSRDMEMSCDERVLASSFDPDEYGETLLSFASRRRFPAPDPLAFGESSAAERIKNALRYKKPGLIVSIVAALLCCAVLAACSLNARGDKQANNTPEPTAAPTERATETASAEPTADPTVKATEAANTEPAETPAPGKTAEIMKHPPDKIVYDPDGGTVYMENPQNSVLYAVEGENVDAIFGVRELSSLLSDVFDEPRSSLTLADSPLLLGVADRALFFCRTSGGPNDNDRKYHSLIYLDSLGAVHLRGSNPGGMFGDFAFSPDDRVLLYDAAGIGRDSDSVCAVTTSGELYVWKPGAMDENGGPMLAARNVDPNWLYGGYAYLSREGGLLVNSYDISAAESGIYNKVLDNIAAFRGSGRTLLALDTGGRLILCLEPSEREIPEKLVLAENVVSFDIDGQYACWIDSEGGLYRALLPDGRPVKICSDAAEFSMCGECLCVLDSFGTLSHYGADLVHERAAKGVTAFACTGSGCIYETGQGDLHSWKYRLPEGTDGDSYDIDLFSSVVVPFATTSTSEHWEYNAAAQALLAGDPVDEALFHDYGQYVYFRLEDDGLKAYASKVTITRDLGSGNHETIKEYSDLVAVYPRDVGVAANQSLIANVREYMFLDPADDADFIYQGFAGEHWFALVTLDESLQDLQAHAIYTDFGGKWHEIPCCPGAQRDGSDFIGPLTIFGACVTDENTAYVSYFSKHLWTEEYGSAKPHVFRTADGGRTWTRLDITLPDEYREAFCAPLSPVFEGEHGVMIISGRDPNEPPAWLETNDNGRTWEYRSGR